MRRDHASYIAKTEESKRKQLGGLRQYQKKPYDEPIEVSKPFLKDPRNKDIIFFLETHFFLENRQPIVLEGWQKDFLNRTFPGEGGRPYLVSILGTPRKCGKSTLAAGIILYLLTFPSVKEGEFYGLAVDQDQSRIVHKKVARAIKRSKDLKKLFKVQKDVITAVHNGCTYRVLSSDVDSAEGLNPLGVVMDEAAIGKADLWEALVSGMGFRESTGQKPRALILTSAGYRLDSPFYALYKRCLAKSEPSTYMFWSHDPHLASWTTEKWLRDQRKRLTPSKYQRYHQNMWTSGENALVTKEQLDGNINPGWSPQGIGNPQYRYVLALDLGLSQARTAIAIMHRQGSQHVLDSMWVWSGSSKDPVMISEVEKYILRCSKNFNLESVIFDMWQAKLLAERLQAAGLRIKEFKFSTGNIARMTANLASLIQDGRLCLYPDERLIAELLQIQVVEKSYGQRFSSAGFTDQAVSLAMATLELSKQPSPSGRPQIGVGQPKESISLLNPRNPIWTQKRSIMDRFPLERHFHTEEEIYREERVSRIQVDPDCEDSPEERD